MEVKISENGVWDIHAGGEPQLGDFLSSSVTINPPMKVEIVTGASLAQFWEGNRAQLSRRHSE